MTTAEKRTKLLQMAIKADIAVDRWDNIKYPLGNGKQVRLNFKKTVIRFEWKSPVGGQWTRISSINISGVNVQSWANKLDSIYNHQNGVKA